MGSHRAFIHSFFASLAILATSAGIGGCALFGSGEPTLQRAKHFTVHPPAGWVRKDQDESDQAFRMPSGNLVTLNSSCNRNFETPLNVLTRQLLLGSRNVAYESQEPLKVDEAEGLYSMVTATLEGTPFHLDLFVVTRDTCIFDFSMVSPKDLTPHDRESFRAFIKSFHYGTGKK